MTSEPEKRRPDPDQENVDTNPFLNTEAMLEAAPTLPIANPFDSLAGQRVGPYLLLREIGVGGMGAVYLAERADEEYKKRVAIKIVKRGMDSAEILARFRYERQILASLDHPNIARLIDGGTMAEGMPYFVMEYVEGERIDRYCNAHKLSTRERLQLFRTVCNAIHYAHRNLVVHRDIKPGNILVTADGTVKLLDFGIAKVLDPRFDPDAAARTRTWDRPMTPAYASPEQVRGQAVTTASDIYSLGVVLYELLTGQRPYEVKGILPHEIAKVVCETEPERPSTVVVRATTSTTGEPVSREREEEQERLRKQLKGDLDNIVMMAMRKEPERRYLSVDQFSEDIRRHLDGLPVIARQDNLGYRAGKFIRRHKAGVLAVAMVMVSLAIGIVMTARQARIAERRFNDVRKLANAVLFKYHDQIQNLPGSTPVREMMVTDALEYLDNLSREAGGDVSLQQELAAAYEKIGNVQGHPFHANLGDRAGALRSFQKARQMRAEIAKADAKDPKKQGDLAVVTLYVGDLQGELGDVSGMLASYRRSLEIYESLSRAEPGNLQLKSRVGICRERVAEAAAKAGDFKTALEYTLQSQAITEEVHKANPADKREYQNLSIGYIKVGDRFVEQADYRQALESYRRSAAIHEDLMKQDPNNAEVRRELALIYDNAGVMLLRLQDAKAALESFQKGKRLREDLAAVDPTNELVRNDLTLSDDFIGDAMRDLGQYAEAAISYRRSLSHREAIMARDPKYVDARRYTAIVHEKMGELAVLQKKYSEALAQYRQAISLAEECIKIDPANIEFRVDQARYLFNVGKTHVALNAWGEALAAYQQSRQVWQKLAERGPLSPEQQLMVEKLTAEIAKCEGEISRG